MQTDPVVDSIHRIREEYAKRFGNDLHAICEDARGKQGQDGRRVVKLSPRIASRQERREASA
jgi:hypothetical protein